MSQKENIFRFNHIDKSKTKEEIQEIKELYYLYYLSIIISSSGFIKRPINTLRS